MSALQLPEWAECLNTPSRHKALHGGRGGAKSHSIAGHLILEARRRPLRILCAREVQKSIRDSVKRLLDDKIEACGFRDFYAGSSDTEIRGKNGSTFVFAGLRGNADGIRSLEGIDIAWVEEARTVSQSSIDTLIPTIRREGSELWWSWNPGLPTDPVDLMFRGEKAICEPDAIVREVSYRDNPWFPEVLRRDMERDRQRDPDKYAHIWLGEYQRNSEARVFRNWVVEPFEAPANATFRFGGDWGFSVDPTVLIRCFIGRWENGEAIADDNGRHLFVDYEAYEVGCEIMKTPALFDTVPDSRLWPITADSARPETISHMRLNGFPKIAGAIKGARSVEEGVEFLKSYDIVVHPRCTHVIDELTLYSYETDLLTGSITNKLADKSNNCIDALRYACEGATRAARTKPTPKPVPIPPMKTGFNNGPRTRWAS